MGQKRRRRKVGERVAVSEGLVYILIMLVAIDYSMVIKCLLMALVKCEE